MFHPGEWCPRCLNHAIVEKNGRWGTFLGCSGYPRCSWAESREDSKRRREQKAKQMTSKNAKSWKDELVDPNLLDDELNKLKAYGKVRVQIGQDYSFWDNDTWSKPTIRGVLEDWGIPESAAENKDRAYYLIATHMINETYDMWPELERKSHDYDPEEKPAKKKSANTPVKKEKKMAVKKDKIVAAAVRGAKVGLADEAGETVLDMAEVILGAKIKPLLDTEPKRSVAKALSAILLMNMTGIISDDENVQEKIEEGCEFVLEAAARDLSQPNIRELRKLGMVLAEYSGKALVDAVKK